MKTMIFSLFLSLVTIACQYDNPDTIYSISAFTNLKVGNYWVYEEIKRDLTNGITSSHYELVSVDGIESQRGNDYFVISGHAIGTRYPYKLLVRDSANHLVNNHGAILLTQLADRPIHVHVASQDYSIASTIVKEESLTIGQNTFAEILNRQDEITFRREPLLGLTIHNDNQYARSVGLIRQTATSVSVNSHIVFERKLIEWGTRG